MGFKMQKPTLNRLKELPRKLIQKLRYYDFDIVKKHGYNVDVDANE